MEIIVGMDQCIVDVSRSDFILMIGRQLLVLAMVLFFIFFGSMPISFPLGKFMPFFKPPKENGENGENDDEDNDNSKNSKNSEAPVEKMMNNHH
jgi:hypothetical protein